MMVLIERILFMFSSKNKDNLFIKPNILHIIFIAFFIWISYYTYFVGDQICNLIGLKRINRSNGFTRLIGVFVYMIILLSVKVLSPILCFIIDVVMSLFDDIKSSFKSHDEMIKMKNSK